MATDPIDCDLSAVVRPDLGTVDALARMSLAAKRRDCRLRLHAVSPELRALVALAGLSDVLLGPQREAEEGEQLGGVQEGVEPGDPPV